MNVIYDSRATLTRKIQCTSKVANYECKVFERLTTVKDVKSKNCSHAKNPFSMQRNGGNVFLELEKASKSIPRF